MTEYEWEIGRTPRMPDVKGLGGFRFRRGPVAEYVALEFPRESVAWVVKTAPYRQPERPTIEPSTATESAK